MRFNLYITNLTDHFISGELTVDGATKHIHLTNKTKRINVSSRDGMDKIQLAWKDGIKTCDYFYEIDGRNKGIVLLNGDHKSSYYDPRVNLGKCAEQNTIFWYIDNKPDKCNCLEDTIPNFIVLLGIFLIIIGATIMLLTFCEELFNKAGIK